MSDKETTSLFRQKLELLTLSHSEEVLNRIRGIASRYFLTFKHLPYQDLDKSDLTELMKAQLVVLEQDSGESVKDFSARVENALDTFPRSRLIAVLNAEGQREQIECVQNPRITPMSQTEFFFSLKCEYICAYRCRTQYFEIETTDLFPMTTMTFPAFIRLPLNQRYLAVTYSNTVLTDEKSQRLAQAGGLYILARDIDKYLGYIANYYDTLGRGLKKRARALFLSLCYKSVHLNEILLFDMKKPSEESIKEIYEDIKRIGAELFEIMKGEENLWDIFCDALDGDFWNMWRSPWIAVYASMISVRSGLGDPMVTLLAGVLADVGIYDLEEDVARNYYLSEDKVIPEQQQSSFQKHPILSLNRCLIKKLPLEENVKSVLVCTHERADQKGFPNQVPTENLPPEAQIILFAEKIDQGVRTTMKQTGVGFRFLKEKIWEHENNNPGGFSPEFLDKISDSLI